MSMKLLSVLGIAGLAPIVCKLFGFVTWSWVWVLSPIWILLILAACFGAFIFVMSWIVNK